MDGSTVTLTATPKPGCRFERWDGEYNSEYNKTENPRKIIVHKDESYTAIFKNNNSVVIRDMYQTYKPDYYICKINVATKEMIFQSSVNSSSAMSTYLCYRWDGSIMTGIYYGHSEISFATIQVPDGWGGYREEIDLEESRISHGNPFLWYLSSAGESIIIGNENVGNWIDKNITLRITSIDVNAKLVSFVAEATVGNLGRCIQSNNSWDDAATANFSITATDIPLIVE